MADFDLDDYSDSSADQMQDTNQAILTQASNLSERLDSYVALEILKNYLGQHLSVTKENYILANVALESILENTPVQIKESIFDNGVSIEESMQKVDVALESLWNSILDNISNLSISLGVLFGNYKKQYMFFSNKIKKLEKDFRLATSEEPFSKIIKPRTWFCDFMYTSKPQYKEVYSICKQTYTFIEAHRKLSTDNIKKYTSWLEGNYKDASIDAHVFNSLSINVDDLIYPGSKPFNRSVGSIMVKTDNVMYQGPEMPGGTSFYTQIRPNSKKGMSCTTTMNDYRIFINKYDPISYRKYQYEIYNLAKLNGVAYIAAYVAAMGLGVASSVAIPIGAGLIGAGAWGYYNIQKALVKDTGHNIKITPANTFNTMSKKDIERSLRELNIALTVLNRWYTDVLENNIKQKSIDKIINELFKQNIDPTSLPGKRSIKRYCSGLLNMIQTYSTSVPSYAFKTFDAIARYTEININQYKENK